MLKYINPLKINFSKTLFLFSGRKKNANHKIKQTHAINQPESINSKKLFKLPSNQLLKGIAHIKIQSEDEKLSNKQKVNQDQYKSSLFLAFEENNEQKCQLFLNEIKQKLICQILNQSQQSEKKLIQFLNVKTIIDLKWRKYQMIITNIENQLHLIKQISNKPPLAFTLSCYNKYTLIMILYNHNKLRQIMNQSGKFQLRNKRSKKLQKKFHSDGFLDYHSIAQGRGFDLLKQISPQVLFRTLLMHATAFAVLGEKQKCIQQLLIITSKRFTSIQREIGYVSLLTLLAYHSSQNGLSTVNHQKFISFAEYFENFEDLSKNKSSQFSDITINPVNTLDLIDKLLLKIRNLTYQNFGETYTFNLYYKLLYLTAQNFYLLGQKHEALRVLLKIKKRQKLQIINNPLGKENGGQQFLLFFLQMSISFDAGQYEAVIQSFNSYRKIDTGSSTAKKSTLYNYDLIQVDLVRINLYRLCIKAYEQLTQINKAEELNQELQQLEQILNCYIINEPQMDEKLNPEDWRKDKIRMPSYYFNLNVYDVLTFSSLTDNKIQ